MLDQALSFEGFKVTIVSEGSTAVAQLSKGGHDAVILDVMLPGRDGISILKELRASPGTEDIPVVMLTAQSDDGSTWEGWRAGASYYMTKPFDPDELIRVIRKMISG